MLSDNRPLSLRTSFDDVADDCDAVRPGYPAALVADIGVHASLPSPASILEIGCGTGQATLPFVLRGDNLICLDIGHKLLHIARHKFASFTNVRFHEASFEAWSGPARAFDLVMAATAFHWIEPAVGYSKTAGLLKETGSLALFANEYCGTTPGFAADLQVLEQTMVPDWPDPRQRPDLTRRIAEAAAAIDATQLFSPVVVRTYPWTHTYTSAQYLRLLNTYSNYRHLEPATRERLLAGIGTLLDEKYAGQLTREYLAVLFLAHA